MTSLKFIFRADKTNVGDWWCPPFRYFPFKPSVIGDILDQSFSLENTKTLILGGGGIGSDFFRPFLKEIEKKNIETTVLWGGGVDVKVIKNELLTSKEQDLHGNYFDFMTEVGTRVFSSPQKFTYIPCTSCMNNLFFKYREVKPKHLLGVYSHKRVPLLENDDKDIYPRQDNNGDDLEEKLKFLASCEYIITNTYHGLYWATLLERKVIVLPFKSGLFSFKYSPVFCFDGKITDELLNKARIHTGVLEESRKLNFGFYKYLADKYDLV